MTPTEQQLLEVHKAPVIRLADICRQYLNKNYANAKLAAARNLLPFPAYRLDASQKAPWVVSLSELAGYIDRESQKATASWTTSQV